MNVLCWEQPVLICFVLISPGGPTDGSLRDRNVQQPWHVRERCLFMRAGIHRGEMWYVYSSRVVALVSVHTALITVGYSYTTLLFSLSWSLSLFNRHGRLFGQSIPLDIDGMEQMFQELRHGRHS